jgi:hypothetical protein
LFLAGKHYSAGKDQNGGDGFPFRCAARFGIKSCHHAGLFYTGQVRLNCNLLLLAMLALFALSGAGCSGINTGTSVSPLDFFLPGAGHFLKADPSPTNAPGSFPEISAEVATVK